MDLLSIGSSYALSAQLNIAFGQFRFAELLSLCGKIFFLKKIGSNRILRERDLFLLPSPSFMQTLEDWMYIASLKEKMNLIKATRREYALRP